MTIRQLLSDLVHSVTGHISDEGTTHDDVEEMYLSSVTGTVPMFHILDRHGNDFVRVIVKQTKLVILMCSFPVREYRGVSFTTTPL